MPAVIPLIAAAVSAAGSVAAAKIGAGAAEEASETQVKTAEQVGAQAGRTSEQEAGRVTAAGERGATDLIEAARKAGAGAWLTADVANDLLRSIYGDAIANLLPYQQAGQGAVERLAEGAEPGGAFNRPLTMADITVDPGYEFRLAEGQKALERSAAARGTLLGGGTLRELSRYSQGVASDEYARAFERARAERSDRYGMLANLAGIGQRAVETGIGAGEVYGGRAAGNIMSAGRYESDVNLDAARQAAAMRLGSVGDAANLRMTGLGMWSNALTGGANASAAGTMGVANAWAGALGNIGRNAMDLAYLYAPPRTPGVATGIPSYTPTMGAGAAPKMVYDPTTGQFVYRP